MEKIKHNILGDVPINWSVVKFDTVVELIHGYQFRTSDFTEEGIKIFKITQIKGDGIIDISNCDFINIERLDDFKKNQLKYNDILMALTGATIGKIARFKSKEICLQNYRVGKFISRDKNIFSEDYLYYFLSSNLFFHQLLARQTQSAQQNIGKEDINNMTICFPDLPTQTAIAEILSSLDDKIELNNKINQELENLAQTLFKQWFIDFEFPNQNGDPYKSSGGEMVDSELGEIPKGWEVINIQDLGKIICGKTPSKKISEYYGSDMPFIKIPDMHKNTYIVNSIDNLSVKGYNSQTNKTLPKNSIVVSSIATVGLVSLTSMPSQTNQQINSIIPKVDWLTFYIYDLCKSLNDNFIQLASGGSATLNMNTSTFKNISILQPTEAVLKSYHFLVVSLFEQIEMNTKENQELTNLRDTLLPKLISGELEVNNHNF